MSKAIIKTNSGAGLYQVETVYDRALVDSELELLPDKIESARQAYLDESGKADALRNKYEIINRDLRAKKVALNHYNELLRESYISEGKKPPVGSGETAGGTSFPPPDPKNPPGGTNTTGGGAIIGGTSAGSAGGGSGSGSGGGSGGGEVTGGEGGQTPPKKKLNNTNIYNWYSDIMVVNQLDISSGEHYLTEDAPNGEIYVDDNKLFEMDESVGELEGKLFINIASGSKRIKFKTSRRNDFPLIDETYFQTDDIWTMDYYYAITPTGTKTIEGVTKKVKFK